MAILLLKIPKSKYEKGISGSDKLQQLSLCISCKFKDENKSFFITMFSRVLHYTRSSEREYFIAPSLYQSIM